MVDGEIGQVGQIVHQLRVLLVVAIVIERVIILHLPMGKA